jgi:hypothetical protein
MPYTYRDVGAPEETSVTLHIAGESGGDWSLQRKKAEWVLYRGSDDHPTAEVTIEQEDAWRLFTKGIHPDQVRARAALRGPATLSTRIFQMVSIMA